MVKNMCFFIGGHMFKSGLAVGYVHVSRILFADISVALEITNKSHSSLQARGWDELYFSVGLNAQKNFKEKKSRLECSK